MANKMMSWSLQLVLIWLTILSLNFIGSDGLGCHDSSCNSYCMHEFNLHGGFCKKIGIKKALPFLNIDPSWCHCKSDCTGDKCETEPTALSTAWFAEGGCNTYKDCPSCVFYERCCFKDHDTSKGVCLCGVNEHSRKGDCN